MQEDKIHLPFSKYFRADSIPYNPGYMPIGRCRGSYEQRGRSESSMRNQRYVFHSLFESSLLWAAWET